MRSFSQKPTREASAVTFAAPLKMRIGDHLGDGQHAAVLQRTEYLPECGFRVRGFNISSAKQLEVSEPALYDIYHVKMTGASMADQTVSTITAAPRPEVSSTFLQIAVLAALSATGMLATNILLPSLPQMAASLKVSSASVGFWQMLGAAIGVWLAATVSHDAMFALGIVLTVALLLALGLYTMRAKGRSAG